MKDNANFLVGKAPKRKRARKRIKTKGPVLGQYGISNMKLRGVYKGKTYRAYVLKDGEVRFNNKRYNSPSLAGVAARKRATNGWNFWNYLRGPGDWVPIDYLRK